MADSVTNFHSTETDYTIHTYFPRAFKPIISKAYTITTECGIGKNFPSLDNIIITYIISQIVFNINSEF